MVPSLVSQAHGKILELGPGPGNQIQRFDFSQIEKIYAVDPNPNFAEGLAAKLKKCNVPEDKYKFIACGVEDSDVLRREGVTEGSLDTVLSIQVLCAVGDVKSVVREIWTLLKPGGKFVFWEHGRHKDGFISATQCELPYSFFRCLESAEFWNAWTDTFGQRVSILRGTLSLDVT